MLHTEKKVVEALHRAAKKLCRVKSQKFADRSTSGLPDMVFIGNCVSLWIEVKRNKRLTFSVDKLLSELQKVTLRQIHENIGYSYVISYYVETKEWHLFIAPDFDTPAVIAPKASQLLSYAFNHSHDIIYNLLHEERS